MHSLFTTTNCTQDEITRLRFRFHNGYSTETWISTNGNVSNRCGKHGCTLRFRNCGSTETHSLNSRFRNVYAVTETLIAIVFPRLVNSTDTQLSAGFPKSSLHWAKISYPQTHFPEATSWKTVLAKILKRKKAQKSPLFCNNKLLQSCSEAESSSLDAN